LIRVECLARQQVRLTVQDTDRKLTKLLIADPAKVVYIGNGLATLGCGAQKPRQVAIGFFTKPNPKLATAGEVSTIEFQ
jgi:hypothetical protein